EAGKYGWGTTCRPHKNAPSRCTGLSIKYNRTNAVARPECKPHSGDSMTRRFGLRLPLVMLALCLAGLGAWYASSFLLDPPESPDGSSDPGDKARPAVGPVAAAKSELLEQRFTTHVQPFLQRYCISCHGSKKPKAELDLSRYASVAAIAKNSRQWELVLEPLEAREMPPEDARVRPEPGERAAIVAWVRDLLAHEAQRNAGDPGTVLARRLSNAEFDYTIRDLTGVDIRPTREFPVDPANPAGFDNSGESLVMSPALLKKYLAAARLVADHVILEPEG